MLDLNDLIDPIDGWTLVEAYDINDLGQIAAYGYNTATREYHAFLLSRAEGTVPAPSTLALVGLAMLGLANRQRRSGPTGRSRART